jgi:hypothetical protein
MDNTKGTDRPALGWDWEDLTGLVMLDPLGGWIDAAPNERFPHQRDGYNTNSLHPKEHNVPPRSKVNVTQINLLNQDDPLSFSALKKQFSGWYIHQYPKSGLARTKRTNFKLLLFRKDT